MKAICLVPNKLFPMASISRRIEDFANEKLNSFLEVILAAESATTEMPTPKAHKTLTPRSAWSWPSCGQKAITTN